MIEEHCRKHGPYMAQATQEYEEGLGYWDSVTPCPTCVAEKEAMALEDRRKRAHFTFRDSDVPLRFQEKQLVTYDEGTKEQKEALKLVERYADNWPEMMTKGTCVVLCGKPGTGKTHLACGLIYEVIYKHGGRALYRTASGLIREIRATWGNGSTESESAVLKKLIGVDLLVIDEIGVQNGTESERNQLFEVINGRYERVRPTVIIGNVPYPEMSRFVGDRVLDRLREGGGVVIPFTWSSHRDKAEVVPVQ